MRDLIHTEERDGFTIRFYRREEDCSPRGQFQNEDGSDDEDTLAKIDSGFYDCWEAYVVSPGETAPWDRDD